MVKYLSLTIYNAEFYKDQMSDSELSARLIVPVVMQLIHPKSVIDVGCGVGTWLAVYAQNGVEDFRGVDGNFLGMLNNSLLRKR